MPDMIARLYDLPELEPVLRGMTARDIDIRPALALEKAGVLAWVAAVFPGWLGEAEAAFSRLPVACHIAVKDREVLGFACYDTTCRNFFGPMGVGDSSRDGGIGRALLLSVLHAQRAQGYAYAIIGGVGPADFYARTVGAAVIPGSEHGILAPVFAGRSVPPPKDAE
ncbi:GNAT family N-acetyltransferase [Iodidimonas sp. SYSU 1G8]|uniref:GNAT family N-acetyltransferase n=1 Tax=Iodidimonas sp. SYSU 1G8 TaxID=3133967 RepID=UPI0031FEFAED